MIRMLNSVERARLSKRLHDVHVSVDIIDESPLVILESLIWHADQLQLWMKRAQTLEFEKIKAKENNVRMDILMALLAIVGAGLMFFAVKGLMK